VNRILFVDDELQALSGLRKSLYRWRGTWDMAFVGGGHEALAEFERKPHDVIVTDMRMPVMSGAELLATISERWPDAIRIVLSGYADQKDTIRLVPLAHQYLGKPCEAERLINTIERCLRVRQLLERPDLRAVVGRIRQLPALPRTYAALREVLARPEATRHDVADVVSADAVITGKVLQVVNSAFFRLPRTISRIDEAVSYLGFAAVRNLALSAEVFTQWKPNAMAPPCDVERLERHAHAVAAAAYTLTAKTPICDEALLAGLLHDLGYRILMQECPREMARALEQASARSIPLHEAETSVIGASHAEVGAYLLGIWGLPYSVIEAVAYHHLPRRVEQKGFDVLAALALAHFLSPPDEAEAFGLAGAAEPVLGPDYLSSVSAPFDWTEAERRVSESSRTEG
jgi:HD-like signal output (HDOD) protein/ActR/RegA family two-component response regulator